MHVNENAPVIVRSEIEIQAEPELVWRVLTLVDEWPAWNPKVERASIEGEVKEGTLFHWKTGASSIESTIQSVEYLRSITWTGRTLGISAEHMHEFRPTASGTLVTTVESWEGALVNLLRVPTRKMLRTSLEDGLRHLKAECERRVTSALSSKVLVA